LTIETAGEPVTVTLAEMSAASSALGELFP